MKPPEDLVTKENEWVSLNWKDLRVGDLVMLKELRSVYIIQNRIELFCVRLHFISLVKKRVSLFCVRSHT